MTLRDQLQQTLGSAYTLEHELGGGGMSRVFLAEDRALGQLWKRADPELQPRVTAARKRLEALAPVERPRR